MGATTYLVPPLAILIGWALLGEAPEALAFVGGALCLGGSCSPAARSSGRRRQYELP
jgi:drug/metabolite transporter (DMT)-like permease